MIAKYLDESVNFRDISALKDIADEKNWCHELKKMVKAFETGKKFFKGYTPKLFLMPGRNGWATNVFLFGIEYEERDSSSKSMGWKASTATASLGWFIKYEKEKTIEWTMTKHTPAYPVIDDAGKKHFWQRYQEGLTKIRKCRTADDVEELRL